MLNNENTRKALEAFKDYVIKQSRANLTRGQKNVSSDLYNSLKGVLDVGPNSFSIKFEMEDYGKFQDQGVKGATSTYSESSKSPFKFGTGTGKKGGLRGGIKKWVEAKRFQFRDVQGRFTSYESTAYIIARSVFNKGIKASLFFTKPFEKGFKNLPNDLKKAYGLDVEEFIEYTIKN
mgnify:FL=1|jgi:hypothetical protein|tara:strand:+ start:3573 stop:4103 length:531 start_codon:yes stop_codon:yes gene_type:complete